MHEWKFEFDGATYCGKRWGDEGALPVIALHGWLDNCATFDFLAPHLKNVDLIALDLAGQGKSDHRKHGGAYNIWLDIMEVIAVANDLGWKQFALLGHSRGAMISTLIAGTFPDRVSHLAVIEAFAPMVVEAKEAPQQLANAVQNLLDIQGKERSLFPTFNDAVKAREKGFLKLCNADALALAKRGVLEKNGKFFWNNDIKLNAPSEVKFTREQAQAFIDRIQPEVAIILGEQGFANEFSEMKDFIESSDNVQVSYLPGGHHLHMSEQCEQVAEVLNRYFSA